MSTPTAIDRAPVVIKSPVYQLIAQKIQAYQNCIKSNNEEWQHNHAQAAYKLTYEYLPSGSGIDCGTKLDIDASNADKLVFLVSYHHMDENGMYDGWTEHTIIVKPSLTSGIELRLTGRDRNSIKEYLYEVFYSALTEEIALTY